MDEGGGLDSERVHGGAAIAVSHKEAAAAAQNFHHATPRRSAKRVLFATQGAVLIALGYLAWRGFEAAPHAFIQALVASAYTLFAAAILWRLFAAASLKPLLSRIAGEADVPTYTILCPVYREASVLGDLMRALAKLDYPMAALDVKLLIEADDEETLRTALTFHAPFSLETLVLPPMAPRTKPKALNVGLARARGDYTVVYDAEDRPHPLQLRAALAAFQDGGPRLACVQAPLAVDNADASWIARQFAAEYAIQFREILPFLSRLSLPLPLGGSSNHFRTEALRAGRGWDPFNVCEDRSNFASKLNRFRTSPFHIPFVSQSYASAA